MLHLLTFTQAYDAPDNRGVFSTVEKAKEYVTGTLGAVQWSDPTHRIDGAIWANYAGGHLRIEPVTLDPAA